MKKINTKAFSLVLTAAMSCTMMPIITFGQDEMAKTVKVSIRSQMDGKYMHSLQSVDVSSNLAESYGYEDDVENGVSALDALVKAHELKFGKSFTKENAKEMLNANDGYVTKLFNVETPANGFLLNSGYPNDGTESSWGGYNGKTVSNQEIKDNDVLDFYTYADTKNYTDCYTWIDVLNKAKTNETLQVKVSGCSIMCNGYKYKTPEDLKNGEDTKPIENIKLGWIDVNTGSIEEIPNVVTNKLGIAEILMPSNVETKYLVALKSDDNFVLMNSQKVDIILSDADIKKENTPKMVTGVAVTGKTYSSISIKWSKNDKAASYNIYRATSKNGTYLKIANVGSSTLTYTNKNLLTGKTYYYKVTGVNNYAEGQESNYVYTMAAPYQTKNAYVHNYGKKAFKIGWAKQSGVTGYRVYKSTSRNGSYNRIATIKGDKNTSFVDKNVKKGKTYYYKVRAYKLSLNNKMIFGSYSGIKYRTR